MDNGYTKLTKILAKDIANKRKKAAVTPKKEAPDIQMKKAIYSLNKLHEKEHLKNTLDLIQHPQHIIGTFINNGISGLAYDFIAPITCILINHSSLSHKNKTKLENTVNNIVKNIPHKDKTDKTPENTDLIETNKTFKLVA